MTIAFPLKYELQRAYKRLRSRLWLKKLPQPSRKQRKKPCVQLVKKPPKLNEKTKRENRGKSKALINEKPLKLNKETRKKTDYLMFCLLLV